MSTAPDEPSSVIDDMWTNLVDQIGPLLEHIKFLQGHGEHEGWGLKEDPESGYARYHCGCGEWLDDKEEAEADDCDGKG